ncbi:Peptidoglycan-N-acetylmuramic acid deacetylase PdaC [termite gut metagenome]|uniref:Peptidoglycan-N-acetylmuramic acid deacetylase PdaC n=1 Tax=termite gut metagenome TaxID=433724 RepID=A0A5J4S6F3_9ZZZZ
MKRQYLFTAFLAVTGFFSSCYDSQPPKGALAFSTIQLTQTQHLFEDTLAPACELKIDYTYPVDSSEKELLDSLNKLFIIHCFGEEYVGKEATDVVRQYAETYTRNYREDVEDTYLQDKKNKKGEDMTEVGGWYSYGKGISSEVQFYEKNLLVYCINTYEYTGGAHGITLAYFLNIDLTKRRLLRLDDIFKGDDYRDTLSSLLWNQLIIDNKVDSREELENMGYGSTGNLTPGENFYLDREGITFYFNVYDFTPYVMGATEIKLPYDQVKGLINLKGIIN